MNGKRVLRAVGVIVGVGALAALPLAPSIHAALVAPGTDTTAQRLVEWGRDHGLDDVIDAAERVFYAWDEAPTGGIPDPADEKADVAPVAPLPAAPVVPGPPKHLLPPEPLVSPATPALADEGVWVPFGPVVDDRYAAWVTSIRPDARHTSSVDRVVWIDPEAFKFEQHCGDKLEKPWARPNFVPPADQPHLLAAFADGFRLSGSKGGFFLLGVEKRKLRDTAASLVVDKQGHIGVGRVPRDYPLETLESARQNLDLIVDGGKVDPKLVKDPNEQWGYTGPANVTAVFRSGAGVRADGSFVYVAGPALSIVTLGETLVRAGAVRGMQLEINKEWVSFNTYAADPKGVVHGTKLDKSIQHPGDRYLTEDTRDFMAVMMRPADANGTTAPVNTPDTLVPIPPPPVVAPTPGKATKAAAKPATTPTDTPSAAPAAPPAPAAVSPAPTPPPKP